MHHSDVIKLVEKFLADPKSVSIRELRHAYAGYTAIADVADARAGIGHVVYAAVYAARAADNAAECTAYATRAAKASGGHWDEYWAAEAGHWTTEARQRIAEYHELTKDSN